MTAFPTNQHPDDGHCPDRDQLSGYVMGKLAVDVAEVLEDHVDQCPGCQATLETLGDLSDNLILSIRKAATEQLHSEDQELYELARRAALVSLEATQHDAGTQATKTDDDVRQLGQYRFLEKLGQGGMGAVYKAMHPRLKREVAIKVLPAHRMRDPQAIERFHREMEAVGRLDHPNIVRAHDAGEEDGRHFLVMEFLEGMTLSKLIRSGWPISVREAVEAIRQAALGIEHAHDHGLIHRDIKPSNLMRLPDGTVKVLDLGLAHFQWDLSPDQEQAEEGTPAAELETPAADGMTLTGQAIGTLGYMSPEQVLGLPHLLDHRTDVYSLGLTLYELLTMRPAFAGTDGKQLLRQIVDQGPCPPRQWNQAIPEALEAIVLKAVAKDREARYATAQELADALGKFLQPPTSGRQKLARGLGRMLSTGQRVAKRHPWASLATAAVCLMLMIPVVMYVNVRFAPQPTRSQPDSSLSVASHPQRTLADSTFRQETKDEIKPHTGEWIDLLQGLDLDRDRVLGQWYREGADVVVAQESPDRDITDEGFVRLMLPIVVEGSYDLQVEFTRLSGNDSVVIGLPVGTRTGTLHFSAHAGQVGGLERIDDLAMNNPVNPTFKRSSLLENNRRYHVLASVRTEGENVAIEVALDGRPYVRWAGKQSSLSTGIGWWLPGQNRPALGSNNGRVAFHTASLGLVSGKTSPVGVGVIRTLEGPEGPVHGLALSPDGHTVVARTLDGVIQIWDLEGGAELFRRESRSEAVRQVGFLRDGRHLVSASDNGIVRYCWNHSGSDVRWFEGSATVAHCVAVSADGRFLAAGCDDDCVRVLSTLKNEETYCGTGLPGKVTCVALSPLGDRLVAACDENPDLQLVSLERQETIQLPGHEAEILAATFSSDGRQIATADKDGMILLWDVESGEVVHRLAGHTDSVWSLAFSSHGHYLLSGSSDNSIRLWDVAGEQEIHRFDEHTSAVRGVSFCEAFSTSGRYAVSGSEDGTIRFWLLPEVVAETDRLSVPQEMLIVVPGEDLPQGEWVNLLASVDAEEDRVRGDWHYANNKLTNAGQEFSRFMLPVSLEGSYDLMAGFVRLSGKDTVCLVLPVGQGACRLCLSGWQGAVHGLEKIDGRQINESTNPTARPLGSLINGRSYQLSVSVRLEEDDAHIRASLDGEPLLNWTGKQTSLEMPPGWDSPDRTRPCLGTHLSATRFDNVLLRSVSGKASLVPRYDKPREQVKHDQWVDLLGRLDPGKERFDRGRSAEEWKRTEDGIIADVPEGAGVIRSMLPVVVEGSYELEVQFTRNRGNDFVAINLPVRPAGTALLLSEQDGELSGIDRIDGRDIAHNPTGKLPGTLVNGQRHTVLAKVNQDGDQVSIDIHLDGKPYIQWSGRGASLGIRGELRLPDQRRPGLATIDNRVTFHSARFRLLSGEATLTAEAITDGNDSKPAEAR